MKLKLIIPLLLLAIGLASCGDSEDSLRQKYIEACADKDFDSARAAVEKIVAVNPECDIDEHWQYVNDKEIYNLLANLDKDKANRILYLYNSYEPSQLPDMTDVLEVAMSQGNSYLVSKLIKGGVIPSETVMDEAVSAEDEELVELILSKCPERILTGSAAKFVNKNMGEEKHKNYLTAVLSEKNASAAAAQAVEFGYNDIANEIISNNVSIIKGNPTLEKFAKTNPGFATVQAKGILKKLSELQLESPQYHSEGIVRYFYDGDDYSKYKLKNENTAINSYNTKLKELYLDALAIGRKDIALKVVNEMRPEIEGYRGESREKKIKGYVVDSFDYLIYHNYDEINRLKSKLK